MRTLPLAALLLAVAPALAQTPEPTPPPAPTPTPAPTPAPAPAQPPQQKSSWKQRLFFGGGVGASFGDVDYVEVSPLVGFHVIPRLDIGVQPFYRWTDDGRYNPSVSLSDYGAGIWARVHIFRGLFGQVGYEYTNYEYVPLGGGTTRGTYDAFLAGGGWSFPVAPHVGFYASVLYDFSYDSNDPFRAYDSPVRFQVGVSAGF